MSWEPNLPFFLHPSLVYWDLTLPICRASWPIHFPMESLGSPLAERDPNHNLNILVRDDERMTLCRKALGVSWWMDSLGRSRGKKSLGPLPPMVLPLRPPLGLHSPWYPLGFSTHCPRTFTKKLKHLMKILQYFKTKQLGRRSLLVYF